MAWKDNSNTGSLIKPAGEKCSLITASLLLTALTATQPAGKSNGHLNSRSISRPVSSVWLGRVPWCQPVCWCRRSCTHSPSHTYYSSKTRLMRSNSPKWKMKGSCGSSQPLWPAPALFTNPIPNILPGFSPVFNRQFEKADETEVKPFNTNTSPLKPQWHLCYLKSHFKKKLLFSCLILLRTMNSWQVL